MKVQRERKKKRSNELGDFGVGMMMMKGEGVYYKDKY